MLPGFEDITYNLTEYERGVLVPVFVRCLSKKIGVNAAVTSKQMVAGMEKKNIQMTDARVRKIINYIRRSDLVKGLVASSKGYYVSKDVGEVKAYIDSLQGREKEIHRIRTAMSNYLKQLMNSPQGEMKF